MKNNILLDFLHKSKIVKRFLGKTKLSTAVYGEVHEERRQVLTTKSPTRSAYAGSLLPTVLWLLVLLTSCGLKKPLEVPRQAPTNLLK
ncbi:hypothetical protein [Candidatus Tisiphia endosymbiont of Beris chalybata]|uniref:hypothetical protein n=1 Tax=Candidatus Tisiphia endosymbiont of Beris chalybata TaxID=3066262 RepID=UPI00312CB8EC